ncbi:YqhG family protein [Paenibacillus agricola]|uniref:Uncharacterized protein n=1 Tax=Paenibacillus agricola TaxID=2716264 RepID=A0ABX0J488_9BACL|nr:YqhG family protein [Paenibacillus agricola]NHN31109.1 hypothetical protein [Paenibacillus agricola]
MKREQIETFVMRFLHAEQCDILEKHPAYVTAKLSPSADKELTYRPYYWSFVERTGITPETLVCTFVFDPEAHKAATQPAQAPAGQQLHPGAAVASPADAQPFATGGTPPADAQPFATGGTPPAGAQPYGLSAPATAPAGAAPPATAAQQAPDSILGRYFGFVPTQITTRIAKDEVTFGSRRLLQLFDVVRSKGRFVHLYEQTPQQQQRSSSTIAYENWLQVNFKVDMACDMKRSEIHSLGIQLGTGEIRSQFQNLLLNKQLTPRLPAQVFIVPDQITLARAVIYLEAYLEQRLREIDHHWAEEAGSRLLEEIERISSYYEPLLQSVELERKQEISDQYRNRKQEIEWQYQPRIVISVINCGLFHLRSGSQPNN